MTKPLPQPTVQRTAPRIWLALIAPVLLFLAVFYVFPLGKILALSLGQAISKPAALQGLLGSYYPGIFFFTVWQAALSSLLTLLLALPGAFLLARYCFRGKKLFETLVTIPFALPTVVVATAFRTLADPDSLVGPFTAWAFSGYEDSGQSLALILGAHVFFNFSLALRVLSSFWTHLPPSLSEAARLAGASGLTAFRTILLPLLAPALGAAGLLVFLFCFSSFGVVLLLGGTRYCTLEVEIYRQAAHVFNLPLAAALSLIQLAAVWLVAFIQGRLHQRCARPLAQAVQVIPLAQARPHVVLWGSCYLLLTTLTLILPLVSLMLESLRPDQAWSLHAYTSLFENPRGSFLYVSPLAALGNSLLYALTATLMAVPLGLAAAGFVHTRTTFARALDPLLTLPMTTSAVTLGFGFLIALDQPPLHLRSSWILVPIAHALVAFPFVLRTVLPALAAVPDSLREAAATLGAGPWTIQSSVILPLLARATTLGAIYSFVISLGEFGATVFLARPHAPTLPMLIYRAVSLPGSQNHAQALASSSLLMLVCALCFFVLERCKTKVWGNF